jgi:hypothetical protein
VGAEDRHPGTLVLERQSTHAFGDLGVFHRGLEIRATQPRLGGRALVSHPHRLADFRQPRRRFELPPAQPRADEHETVHPIRIRQREVDRDPPTERQTDDVGPLDLEML